VRLKVDIIVTAGGQATRAAKEATPTIPIIIVNRNLKERERSDLVELTRKSRGRPGNLTERERRELAYLVRKGATGDGDSDWIEVAKTVAALIPPSALADAVTRFRRRF
jgi:pyruvate kinase